MDYSAFNTQRDMIYVNAIADKGKGNKAHMVNRYLVQTPKVAPPKKHVSATIYG